MKDFCNHIVKEKILTKEESTRIQSKYQNGFNVYFQPIHGGYNKMLFFLPDPNRKIIRYYGIYAHGVEERLQLIQKTSWVKAIEHCFHVNPISCPDCGKEKYHKTVENQKLKFLYYLI
ncbi:MAG: hypothetical protein H7A23_18470 [Leptospiraceae bacterium]|nr:hypothetical protein [Leptospiraceae bacterium]